MGGGWLAFFLMLAAAPLPRALADGGAPDYVAPPSAYGPPPELPPGSRVDDDPPRRDIHMGTVDHMRMGTDDEGNSIMEVRPRPKKVEQQPQMGPIYVYPQLGAPNTATGQATTGQSGLGQGGTTPGKGGTVTWQGGQPGQTGQTAPRPSGRLPASGQSAGGGTGNGF